MLNLILLKIVEFTAAKNFDDIKKKFSKILLLASILFSLNFFECSVFAFFSSSCSRTMLTGLIGF